MDMEGEVVEAAERFRAINMKDMDGLAEKYPRLKDKLEDIKLSGMIFPFSSRTASIEQNIPRLRFAKPQHSHLYLMRNIVPEGPAPTGSPTHLSFS